MRLARFLLPLAICLALPAASLAAVQPTLNLAATGAGVGQPVHATATLAGGEAPTGTIEFEAFAAGDPTCAGAAAFTDSATVNAGNGDYPSADFTPTVAGSYHWSAVYSGDGENEPAGASCSATSVVAKAAPDLSTVATSATIGAAISDSATISSGFSPGGEVTFKAFGPDDVSCAGAVAFESSIPVSGNASYGSGNFTPATAGAYRWSASYSGDENNAAAASACNAANETSTVSKASPSLATTASGATVGAAISDSGTISGGAGPTGTLTFKAFGPADTTCTAAALFTANIPVAGNATYGSGNFTPATAGAYRWTASYGGDANNNAATSACNAANETSTVSKASPSLATTAAGATVGAAISDSGTISGGAGPTGTLTFKAFGPADTTCTAAVAFESSIPVSGNASYGSGNFTPATAGAYRWSASYSGDENNAAAASACNAANETSTVSKASPSLATTASGATVGAAISDSGTISGGAGPTGTLTFKAFGPADTTCTAAVAFESSIPVSGNASYGSGNFTPATAGAYRWTASYGGDANNNAATSACNAANETSTVSKASPSLATTAAEKAPVGFPISDSATLANGFSPTGQIVFKAYGPSDPTCANTAAFESTVAVSGAGPFNSAPFNGALLGTYRWTASYGGDANNATATSACNALNETSTIGQITPTLSTTAAGATIGSPISDSAALSGFSPTGQLVFKAFGPDDANCSGAVAYTATVPVTVNGSYGSGNFNAASLGAYRWTVDYSGDANNKAVTSACNAANETSTVAKFAPALAAGAAGATIGSPITEFVTFAGGSSPTGQIVFRAYGPDDAACSGAPVFTAPVDVTPGNATYASGAFTPAKVGAYRWTASYSGNAINAAAVSACNAASSISTVAQAAPAIGARASASSLAIGVPARDMAALAGGVQPTGSVVYRLYGPGDAGCSSQPLLTDTVPVSGNGTYTSGSFAPAAIGQYRFTATYSGDAANHATATACAAAGQGLTVRKRAPAVSAKVALRGRRIVARANLSGAASPRGKLLFQIFGPNDGRCSRKPVLSARVRVHGGGSYKAVFRARRKGVYRLAVSYAGDAWNKPAASGCHAAGQSVRVR